MLLRKLFRTAWKYKAQFVSMVIMVAIGTGMFLGFNMEWFSLYKDTERFYEETGFADYRLYDKTGFTADAAEKLRGIDGVVSAERAFSVNVTVEGQDKNVLLSLNAVEGEVKFHVTDGAGYDSTADGFWLSDRFAEKKNIKVGDDLTLTYSNKKMTGKILGLVKISEYLICVSGESQLMPDYDVYAFVYVTPEKLVNTIGADYFPQVNIVGNKALLEKDKDEVEDIINAALGKTTLVISKEDYPVYSEAKGEEEEGKTMGFVLPVLFLLIGVLTMITTMHRIAANEKTQIGTLKALGFKDRTITLHYTSYGFTVGLIGSALGVALGYLVAAVIVSPNGMMATYFDMPYWNLYIPWFCWVIMIITLVFLTLISYLSVRKMLKGTAADALRPYVPKKVKPLKIEKTKAWGKLSFGNKWNLRDVTRHRTRSAMTLFGIVGCMILLVGGLGMNDTMNGFLSLIGNNIYNYETKIIIDEQADTAEVIAFAEATGSDYVSSSQARFGDRSVAVEIYNVSHDKFRLTDKRNRRVELSDDGVYPCMRLSEGLKTGDEIEFSFYGSDEVYRAKVAGFLRSVMTENIVMSETCAKNLGIDYKISALYTDNAPEDISAYGFISNAQSKQTIMDTYDTFMEIMLTMVLMLVIAALVLGVIVLYNLGVMSYVERYRELATLKVVGFKNKHIGKLLISQNMWLTVIGVLIGLPAGVGVLKLLLVLLASEYELTLILGPITYLVSILLTFGVSLAVGLLVARKNRKINMVEALKGAE